MTLFRDLKGRRLLYLKGGLFLVLGLGASALLWAEAPTFTTAALLVLVIWSFCRCYYFLFYVLEKYAGREQRYAGLLDALKFIVTGKNRS